MGLGVPGLGCRFWGAEVRVPGLGCRVWSAGLGIAGFGVAGFWVPGSGWGGGGGVSLAGDPGSWGGLGPLLRKCLEPGIPKPKPLTLNLKP